MKARHTYSIELEDPHHIRNISVLAEAFVSDSSGGIDFVEAVSELLGIVGWEWVDRDIFPSPHIDDNMRWVDLVIKMRRTADKIEAAIRKADDNTDWDDLFRHPKR